ncbi:fibronectin type III domain-containing protein [Trujillonella endophytica]|nr:fibronectin type III domain-containing protein [Trujillella endophytica]
MSTTLLSLGGVASATDELEGFSFTTDADRADEYGDQLIGEDGFTVPEGYCSVSWFILGGGGGWGSIEAEYDADGSSGGILRGSTPVVAGQHFDIDAGTEGGDGSVEGGGSGGLGVAPGEAGQPVLAEADPDPDPELPPALSTVGGGGGGGAGSVVTGTDFVLKAFGGDGGGGEFGGAGAVVGVEPGVNKVAAAGWVDAEVLDGDMPANGVSDYGSSWRGIVEGYVEPCAAPEVLEPPLAPVDLFAVDGNGEAEILFNEDYDGTESDSFEYNIVGTNTWVPATDTYSDAYAMTSITVDGLTNGQSYDVRVRGVSDAEGDGAASAPVTVHPFVGASAPQGVSVTPGVASVRVNWSAFTTPGSFPVEKYAVDLISIGGEWGDRDTVCETALDAPMTCLVGLDTEAGVTYRIVVSTVDSVGHFGADSAELPVGQAASPSVPSSVPSSDGPISRPDGGTGSIAAGSTVVLSGDGFLPGSTVSLIVYSEPQVLTHTVADANGHFEVSVVVPAGLASGSHTLVASGVDLAGNARFVTLPITVTGGTTGSGGLAYTGASVAVPAIGGLAALAIGGGLVLAGKRRRTAE